MPVTRPTRQALALVAVLALLAVACNTTQAPTPTASASPAGRCEPDDIANSGIRGRVVDSDGNPLTDILVQIDNTAGFTGSARTPEDGTFTAPGVTGVFVITTVDIDYDSVTQRVTVPCGETVDVEIILTPSGQ
jgi:Carboxypeptidase regulatory-like domain